MLKSSAFYVFPTILSRSLQLNFGFPFVLSVLEFVEHRERIKRKESRDKKHDAKSYFHMTEVVKNLVFKRW